MEERVVIDPVTRIEGHLRMEATVEGGIITDAYSIGTMVRGIEIIVKDRDPRDVWAYVMRVCGVCTSMHGLASVRAVENAMNIRIPLNAEMARNLMLAAMIIRDHLVHFYQLQALDWISIPQALSANADEAAAIAVTMMPVNSKYTAWGSNSPGYFRDIQRRVKSFLSASPKNNIFSPNRWCWNSKLYHLPPAVSLIGLAHYMQCLDFQKEICKIQAVFGGKNPHPNYLVGGMACAVNMNDPNAINIERLNLVDEIIGKTQNFVNQVYLPDCMAIMSYYPEWTKIGGGLSNYLTYGDFPTSIYGNTESYLMPRGIVMNRDMSHVEPFDPELLDGLQEFVNNSWYTYTEGNTVGLHPSIGETNLNYTGPSTPYNWIYNPGEPYSWIKAPRYKHNAMEVGPLARCTIAYALGKNSAKENIDACLNLMHLPFEAMWSTAGRTLARAIEATEIAEYMSTFYNILINNIRTGDSRMFNNEKWEPSSWAEDSMGYSLNEASRGALAHYVHIHDKAVANYQMVVPTTWNASPRISEDNKGAFEAAVIGTPVHGFKPDSPEMALSVIRTLHSFDPCMACSVHLYNDKGERTATLNTNC